MTLAEKATQNAERLRGKSTAQRSRIPMVERGPPRSDNEGVTEIPEPSAWLRLLMPRDSPMAGPDWHRGTHQARAKCARGTTGSWEASISGRRI